MQERFTEANEAGVPDKLRRYIRILIDLGRLAGEKAAFIGSYPCNQSNR